MHKYTKFIIDWLRLHIDLLELSSIKLAEHSCHINDKIDDRETDVIFHVYGYKLFGGQALIMNIPEAIELKYFYSALHYLNSSTVNTNVTEEDVAKTLGEESIFKKLQEQT